MRAIDADHLKKWVLSRRMGNGGKDSDAPTIEEILAQIDREDTVPTAQPKRMRGKWIVGGIEEDSAYLGSRWYECERCHTPGDLRDKFCRGCGAEMQT